MLLVSWKSESFLWLQLYGQGKQIQVKVLSLLGFHLEELFLFLFIQIFVFFLLLSSFSLVNENRSFQFTSRFMPYN